MLLATHNEIEFLRRDTIHDVIDLQFLQLVFSGCLAGAEIAIHYGIVISPGEFGEETRLRLRQAMIRRLRILVPALFLPSFLMTLALCLYKWHTPGAGPQGIGLAGFLVWIFIRIVRTVGINSATLEWNPHAPPADWQVLVEKVERFHVVATWAAVSSFICFLISALQR